MDDKHDMLDNYTTFTPEGSKTEVYRDFEGMHDEASVEWVRQAAVKLAKTYSSLGKDRTYVIRFGDVMANLMAESCSEVGLELTKQQNWLEISWAVNEVLSIRYWSKGSGIEWDQELPPEMPPEAQAFHNLGEAYKDSET